MAASPDSSETVRRGGPAGLTGRIADRVLGRGDDSAIAAFSRDDWLAIVPDSTLREDVCVAVARTKAGRPPAAIVISREGIRARRTLRSSASSRSRLRWVSRRCGHPRKSTWPP